MPWFAIPYEDNEKKKDLSQHFGIEGLGIFLVKYCVYRIFAHIRRTFFGQNWGVRLICELELKLFFFTKFFFSEIEHQ